MKTSTRTDDKELAYSSYKAALHRGRIDQLRAGELILPTNVQWDITNRCNLNCSFCFYHLYALSDWNRSIEMPAEVITDILSELARMGVRCVEWTGGGEPTLHKDWRSILAAAADLGFEQALVTNGTQFKEDDLPLVREFEWVRFSVDAATRETYRAVKGAGLFDKVLDSIFKLLLVRNRANVVGFSFIVCPENYHEIFKAAELARSLGCDNIRFSLAMTPKHDHLFDGIWEECVRQLDQARSLEDKNFRVFAFSNRINELSLKVMSPHCYYCQFVAVISPTGLYPCCRLKDDGAFNLGSFLDNTFSQIWFGARRDEFVRKVAERGCAYDCWMTEKNSFIHYLTRDNPRHGNFV